MTDQRYRVDRRRFLRDSAFVSIGLVAAACAPGATPSGSGGTAKKGGEFHAAWPWDLPPKGHFNLLSSGNILQGSYLQDLFIPSLGVYRWAEGKWDYWLAESAAQNGENYEVKLKQGIKWDDGKEFTSADVATTYWVGRSQSYGIWTYADKLETPDKYTVRFHISRPSSLVPRLVLRNGIRPDSQFGPFAKELQDLYAAGKTTASDEVKAVAKRVADFRPDPPSVGPYKMDKASVTAAQLTMVKNPGGLFADKVNFDKVVVYQGETDAVTPLVLAGDVDYATHGFPLATDRAFGDQGLRVVRGPLYTGPALYFHWTAAPEFQDKRLRQAVAMAINKPESAKVTYGESAKAQKFMCGISDNIVPLWLNAADQGKLKSYEYDVAKASQLMTDAGFAKGGDGIWAKGGKPLAYELYFPSDFADWTSAANHATDALNKFGIKITPRGAIRSTQLADVNGGKFQIAIMGWGVGNPHPQASYIQDLQTHNTLPAGGGMQYPLKQGDVDFAALINSMGDGFDTDKQKGPVTQLALAYNDLLPNIPLWERYGNNPVNEKKRVAAWPADSDSVYKNGGGDSFVSIMIMNGTLRGI